MAFPLSDGRMTSSSKLLSSFNTFLWSLVRLSLGSLACLRIPQTHPHRSSASSSFSCWTPSSTAVMVSAKGSLVGAGAKFSPSLSTYLCGSVRGRSVRLTTHLSTSWGRSLWLRSTPGEATTLSTGKTHR